MYRLAVAAALSLPTLSDTDGGSRPSPDITRVRQAFHAQVLHAPTVATVGGETRLVYELHLNSFARNPLKLTAVVVEDDVSGRALHRLAGDSLSSAVGRPGVDRRGEDLRVVQKGGHAVIYFDLSLVPGRLVPKRVRHRVEFDSLGTTGTEAGAIVGAVTTVKDRPLVLGPPLDGGPWVAVYDPALENGHRRYLYAVGGQVRIPGRFAIDWMRPSMRGPSGGGGVSADGAGAPVLAVADGRVAATRDGVAETAPGRPRPAVRLADATGNYISLDLGDGRFAFYEHLSPGLLVSPGARVRRGQVIARLGSTGQASRPHLHFHVADANSPLEAEGQPYLQADARVVGAYPSIAAFEAGGPWRPTSGTADPTSLPTPNVVVTFTRKNNGRGSGRRV